MLRYTVIIYKFTQGNLGAKKIARSRFQSPVKNKNRKLRHWRPTAGSLDVNEHERLSNITLGHKFRKGTACSKKEYGCK